MSKDGKYEEEKEEDEKNQDKPKFRLVDKRRINVDEIEAAEESEKPNAKPAEKSEEKKSGDSKAEFEAPESKTTDTAEIPQEFRSPDGQAVSSEEEDGAILDDDPLAFNNIVVSILQTIATVVIVDLGLVPHPQTNLIAKKLEEARRSIDLFELIFNAVRDELPERIAVEFDRAIKDLKLNYVNQL